MKTAIVADAKPYSAEETARIKAEFHRDGYRIIRGLLTSGEVIALREAVDRVFADPVKSKDPYKCYSPFIAVRLFEDDPVFEDLPTREPIISLV
jgi:hypothetical protein